MDRKDVTKLPDGSAFFVGVVRDKPMAWPIVVYRNAQIPIECVGTLPEPWGFFKRWRWALSVTPFYFGGYWR